MKLPSLKFSLVLLVAMAVGILPVMAKDSVVTAVYSNARKDYVRERQPDGTFKTETYVIGNGGSVDGSMPLDSNEAVPFPTIVRVMSRFLAQENYLPTSDAKSADLLLVLYWGKTIPFNDAAERANTDATYVTMNNLREGNKQVKLSDAQNHSQQTDGIQSKERYLRDAIADQLEGSLYQTQLFDNARYDANQQNARLLGYAREIARLDNPSIYAGNGTDYHDLINDVENERYYVVVSAYDYRLAAGEKKGKVLWTTRVSVQAHGNRFDDSLATMLANASAQFGRNSDRLIRQYRPGRVKLGELKYLGTVQTKAPVADEPATGK